MSNIRMDTQRLISDSERLKEVITAIPHLLSELKIARAVLRATWDGEAQEAFENSMVGYENELRVVYDMMATFAESMGEGSTTYHRNEQDVLSLVKHI